MTDELAQSAAFEREHWGPPIKNNRYDRVGNRDQFLKNFEESNLGKAVNPAKGRKYRIVYRTKAVIEQEEAQRRFKEGLKELYPDKDTTTENR